VRTKTKIKARAQTRARGAKELLRRRLRTAILAGALLAALTAIFSFAYYRSLTSKIRHDAGYFYLNESAVQEEITGLAVNVDHVDAQVLDTLLRRWANNNTERLRDRNVMNILLCGVDTESGKALGGNADAILLVSINRREKTITLTSIFRDSYSYINLTGDTENPRALTDRVSAAYSLGGPATLVDTLEDNYKITIDSYISVDFKSFPEIINTLGGVQVDVTQAEADHINSTAQSMHGAFPAGKQAALSGEQALVYTRIQSLDSDAMRSARQRKVLSAIMESAKGAAPGELLEALEQTLQYVVTDLSKDDIGRLSKEAILQGWFKYELRQLQAPRAQGKSANNDFTGVSAYIGEKWLWIVDYPRDAHRLQLALYGKTTIEPEQMEQNGQENYLAQLMREGQNEALK